MKNEKKQKVTKIQIEKRPYSLDEATSLVTQVSTTKFTASVDLDIVLNLKEKDKKEVIRGSITFPHSLGEDKKVVVICEEKDAKVALEAGASKAGPELVDEIANGFSDFDIVIATPAVMPKMVKLGKALGPKGLMPNPKNGTVTTDIAKAVLSFKSGKFNFKTAQDQPVIRVKIAKVNMKPEEIKANLATTLKAVFAESKKFANSPFKKVTLKSTMGAGIKLDINDIMQSI